MKILILGGTGMVGRNLAKCFRERGHEVDDFNPDIDLGYMSTNDIADSIDCDGYSLVVNCVGRKDLRWCEEFPTAAFNVNAVSAGKVAMACKNAGIRFVHLGSDHAYAKPDTVYSRSKRLGHELVLAENPEALVVVTGHIVAPDAPWLLWLKGELEAGRTVQAWEDVGNCPTGVEDLADAMIYGCVGHGAIGLNYDLVTPWMRGMERVIINNGISGLLRVTGRTHVNRYALFTAYARAFSYDEKLIAKTHGDPAARLHPKEWCWPSDMPTVLTRGVEEVFRDMAKGVRA